MVERANTADDPGTCVHNEYCAISIDSSAPVTRDMADQIFGSSSAAVTRYAGEIFVFVNFVIGRDGGIVAYGEACV